MDKIAILDAGSQYGKLIDKNVRILNCESTILPLSTPISQMLNYRGIIISGGPESVFKKDSPKCDPLLFLGDHQIPVLGICYGMQLMNYFYNGKVKTLDIREDGQTLIAIDNTSNIFQSLSKEELVLLTHKDSVTHLPSNGTLVQIGHSKNCISAIMHKNKPQYGLQFHPEVDLTVKGQTIFKNFLFNICGCKGDFTLDSRLETEINEIKKMVGDKTVVVLASGGVDSTVCAKLLFNALGKDKVYIIHIDNGFMRHNESDLVKIALESSFDNHNVKILRCQDMFFNGQTIIDGKPTLKLCETINPEEKRKIIGDTFMKIITEEIEDLKLDNYMLVQGTLRPDLIESASKLASGSATTIKTHHNDTNLVRQKREEGLIIEPLKDYHKDEVRELGEMLGLLHEMVWRHPFPGPGLAIRIICQNKDYHDDNLELIRTKLEIYKSENRERLDDHKIYVHILPIKTVGVQGDGRSYSYVVGLSSNTLNWELFFELAKEIPNVIHGINRVVYIFGDPIKEFCPKITPTTLTPSTIDQLRCADHIFNQIINRQKDKLTQAPVILVPLNFGINWNRSIVIRPFVTRDFMTGVPARPHHDINENIILEAIDNIIEGTPNISRVMYDLTAKPPGTTEWE